ncbi:methyltransferase [Archangium primigenium]|uniref:methyltransferase n=1 Tax=[Archangium] primigenium TaxID=2792470 RepID=UPI00195C1B39|nr:ArsR family transcriptional regulator [Archangium primigenium]
MSAPALEPRAFLHLLFNGARVLDVVETAQRLGLLDALEPGPTTVGTLAAAHGFVPARLQKFLDCLESAGLVRRTPAPPPGETQYTAVSGLGAAVRAVLGPRSQERDRETYDWRALHGHLPEVLRGERSIAPESFDWPPRTPEQVAAFEASMAAGLGPIRETFLAHAATLLPPGSRLLDVGGGDGTLGASLLEALPGLRVDVFNLPACGPLVERTGRERGVEERLGFVAGDFLREPLPRGHDTLAFVRVLHDWPEDTARHLLAAARDALPPGGRVLICEEFRTPARLAAQFFWSYFLMGVDSCASALRDLDFYTRELTGLGFRDVEVFPGPFELVTARRA